MFALVLVAVLAINNCLLNALECSYLISIYISLNVFLNVFFFS
jgi:hypothetical protein